MPGKKFLISENLEWMYLQTNPKEYISSDLEFIP